jgi:uncharacterized protein
MYMMNDPKQLLQRIGSVLLGVLTVLAIIVTIGQIKLMGTDRYQGYQTISVTGTGEAMATPDVATFMYSIEETKKTVVEAQTAVTERSNKLLADIKAAGIDEKDIKTQYYSSYPKYEYQQVAARPCTPEFCPPSPGGKSVITGYTVSQSISVKVRDLDKVSTITQLLGGANVSSFSGPSFEVDDMDAVRQEARAQAINEAKENAKILGKQLGVRVGKLISFSDPDDTIYPMYEGDAAAGMMYKTAATNENAPAPELPTGQTKVESKVQLVYRIR